MSQADQGHDVLDENDIPALPLGEADDTLQFDEMAVFNHPVRFVNDQEP